LIREKTVLHLEADVFGPAIPQHSDGQSRNFAILEKVSMDCMVVWLLVNLAQIKDSWNAGDRLPLFTKVFYDSEECKTSRIKLDLLSLEVLLPVYNKYVDSYCQAHNGC